MLIQQLSNDDSTRMQYCVFAESAFAHSCINKSSSNVVDEIKDAFPGVTVESDDDIDDDVPF